MVGYTPRTVRIGARRFRALLRCILLVVVGFSYPTVNMPGFGGTKLPSPPRCPACNSRSEWKSRHRLVARCLRCGHRYAVRRCERHRCDRLATSLHGRLRDRWCCSAGHQFRNRLCPHCGNFGDPVGRWWWKCRTSDRTYTVHECSICASRQSHAYAGKLQGAPYAICELVEHADPVS